MALAFPNPTRSFDSTVNCVRFSGHDSAIEVSFFVEIDALVKIYPELIQQEAEILSAFDAQIEEIHKAATKVYKQNKGKYVFTLSSDNF
jgi:hypothetical protein